jgi:hypothetical protein
MVREATHIHDRAPKVVDDTDIVTSLSLYGATPETIKTQSGCIVSASPLGELVFQDIWWSLNGASKRSLARAIIHRAMLKPSSVQPQELTSSQQQPRVVEVAQSEELSATSHTLIPSSLLCSMAEVLQHPDDYKLVSAYFNGLESVSARIGLLPTMAASRKHQDLDAIEMTLQQTVLERDYSTIAATIMAWPLPQFKHYAKGICEKVPYIGQLPRCVMALLQYVHDDDVVEFYLQLVRKRSCDYVVDGLFDYIKSQKQKHQVRAPPRLSGLFF